MFRCPVVVPMTFRQRLAGIKRAPPGHGVLLAASAVNSIGLKEPLTVVALDGHGRVLAVHLLAANTTWRHRGAEWIMELDTETPVPPGARVRILVPATLLPWHPRALELRPPSA